MAWADRSPFEQMAIEYCAPRGIPLSVFCGRVVYPGDPMWTEDDQQAAIDWQIHDRLKCPECGFPRDECMADEDDAPAYTVELRRCHACKAAGIEQREMAKNGDPGPGLKTFIRKAN